MNNYLGHLKYFNFFRRLFIFIRFFVDNIQNYEFKLVFIAFKYLISKSTHAKNLYVTTNIGKFELRAESIDFITANSAYEYEVMKVLKDEIKTCDLFIDIGANIGIYSIVSGKSRIKTLAFEPVIANFNALTKNIELNSLRKYVDVFNIGFSSQKEENEFYYNKICTGSSSLYKLKSNANGTKCKVKLEVFDDFKNEFIEQAQSSMIKIDVEGMEIELLTGMKNFIKQKKELKIIIETKHSGEDAIKQKLLSFCGFEFCKIDAYNLIAVKIKK